MRKRVAASVLSGFRGFRPQLEQLTSRLVPAALVDFAAGPLAAFDPSEADVMIVAADTTETTQAEAGAEVVEPILWEEGNIGAGLELPLEIDLAVEGGFDYLTCFPIGDEIADGEELIYYTGGFGDEGIPVDEPIEMVEPPLETGELTEGNEGTDPGVDGTGEIPGEVVWLPDELEYLKDEVPVGEPGDGSVVVDELGNPEVIYYMMSSGAPIRSATDAAPEEAAAPVASNQSDVLAALAPVSPNQFHSQSFTNAAADAGENSPAKLALATSPGIAARCFTGTGGGSDVQISDSVANVMGGTQATLPESEQPEETAAPVDGAGDEAVSALASPAAPAVEEAVLPDCSSTIASPAVLDLDMALSEPVAKVQLEAPSTAEANAEQDTPLPIAILGLSGAAGTVVFTNRRRRPAGLTSR